MHILKYIVSLTSFAFSIPNIQIFFLYLEVVMKFNTLHNASNTKCHIILWKYINDGNCDYFTSLLTEHPFAILLVA